MPPSPKLGGPNLGSPPGPPTGTKPCLDDWPSAKLAERHILNIFSD